MTAAATKNNGTPPSVSALQRHRVETAVTSAISQLNSALQALEDSAPATSQADVVYRCAQCGEPVHAGQGALGWTNWDESTLIVTHKDGQGSTCDSDYQRVHGVTHNYRDLSSFLAALAVNRL